MNRRAIKFGVFLVVWHEIANGFGCGANGAFAATLALFFGARVVRGLGIEIGSMSGPVSAAFVMHVAVWLVAYFCLAPGLIRDLPFSVTLCMWFAVALLGAQCRGAFFEWVQGIDAQWFRDRSEAVVGAAMATLTLCFLSQQYYGSILPLVGCVLLPGLPFSFGWLAMTAEARFRYDAQFGTQDTFTDVGASDEF